MHWAVHWHTAAELIAEGANDEKEHIGLTTWESVPDGKIVKADVHRIVQDRIFMSDYDKYLLELDHHMD